MFSGVVARVKSRELGSRSSRTDTDIRFLGRISVDLLDRNVLIALRCGSNPWPANRR
jgi:hypothetical protein